ncbi:MAG: hypothetical protein BYD32DRAFT_441463 [Podila humilis]|nr:MAG: hypothetical protein BYD32DRAFT_441463 [Podila humilis]
MALTVCASSSSLEHRQIGSHVPLRAAMVAGFQLMNDELPTLLVRRKEPPSLSELGPALNGLILLTLLALLLLYSRRKLYIDPLSLDGPWLIGLNECDWCRTGEDKAEPNDDGADSWSK